MALRTIEIHADSKEFSDFMYDNTHAVQTAIGYLTMWSVTTYDTVTISFDAKRQELHAYYQQADNDKKRYVIGAVWHADEKRFSFHS
jgi:uncharacterized Zn finger protein